MTMYLRFLNAHDEIVDTSSLANENFVFSYQYTESADGDIITPSFSVRIENPGIPWLNSKPGRYAAIIEKLHPYPETNPDYFEIIEHARGRCDMLPSELAGYECELNFRCVPPSEDDVLRAAANEMRIGEAVGNFVYDPEMEDDELKRKFEEYDPLFYSPEASDDPTNVLLATTKVWRWHPNTLQPQLIDIHDSEITHTVGSFIQGVHKSQRMSLRTPPKMVSRLRLIAGWQQSAVGIQANEFLSNFEVDTYNPKSIINSMPQPGTEIGAGTGWKIHEAKVNSITPLLVQSFPLGFSSMWGANGHRVDIRPHKLSISARASYEYHQERQEIFDIYMHAGMQSVIDEDRVETVDQIQLSNLLIDPITPEWAYEDSETLEQKHYEIGDTVQALGGRWQCLKAHDATENFFIYEVNEDGSEGDQLWLRIAKLSAIQPDSAKFFDINRGTRTLHHGLRRLKRTVLRAAMCGQYSFVIDANQFTRAITTEHSIKVIDAKIPGGELTGKVVSIIKRKAEKSGWEYEITIAFPVGKGIVESGGAFTCGDISYDLIAPSVNEPVKVSALPFVSPRIKTVDNDADIQGAAAFNAGSFGGDPVAAIQAIPTKIRIYFDPLRQEDSLVRRMRLITKPIFIPKGIDLSPETP